jgi:photosystem II stability/assembly factor-like uncharacterized protein
MTGRLLLATEDGVLVARRASGDWEQVGRGLLRERVTSIIAREGVALAGTRHGVFRSEDGGESWQSASAGLSPDYVRWLAYHPDVSDREFAGTEPAGIFVSRDGALTWRSCPEVERLRDEHSWFLPYSPRAGCVRGFAFHGNRVYAAVEVGGVLRSDDGGETWQLATGSSGKPSLDDPPSSHIYPDVHSIAVHPSSPELVFAPTGDGFFASRDGGRTWTRLYDCYCRAVWIDPGDARHLILGPADGVDRNGRIEESDDGGKRWRNASSGLSVPWPDHMVERFTQIGADLFAVLSNGELWASPLASLAWRRLLPEVGGVTDAAWLQV